MEKASFLSEDVEEINLLLLGETGVGKSTWINAFVNYLLYETLAEAENNQLFTMIPSKFIEYNENLEEIDVVAGAEDINESGKPGQSQTQKCRVYEFVIGKTTVRLIDTPGIGDTHGVEQDKLNLDNIIKTIQNFKGIHGICILLNPKVTRLSVTFRYCIKELLTHLHKSAVNNMVICFTNSRGTNFKAGESVKTLKVQLEKDGLGNLIAKKTVYFFDSEAFRYLAAIKNNTPINYPEDEKENFSESWKKSMKETKRLLNYLSGLDPHRVIDTVSLCDARRVIQNLTKPLAEIFRLIDAKKKSVERCQEEIRNAGNEIEKLKQLLEERRPTLETRKLSTPNTVCANSRCTTVWSDGYGKSIIKYSTICHEKCQLEADVKTDVKGHSALLRCWAMRGTNYCRSCEHRYTDHLHIKETYHHSYVMQVNESIRNSLNQKVPGKVMQENALKDNDTELKELMQEHATIQEAAVKFAYFLKTYSITFFNDAMKEYLEQLINEEKTLVAHGENRSTLVALEKDLQEYEEQQKIFERKSTTLVSPDEIKQIVESLQQLKHTGKDIKNALQTVTETADKLFNSFVVPFKKTNLT